MRRVDVETAAELTAALDREFSSADVLIMAAAPRRFPAEAAAGEKIHREARRELELDLEPTEDILAALAARRREGQTIVGFAAETSEGIDRAREKSSGRAPTRSSSTMSRARRSASRALRTKC